ncbi:MAG: phosphoenolpyruvate--protein phosphotransferase [Clostridiales Family XIII bacterium]|nr:phosphoenolpyruvate--protein phosphotransferase [Clostridiales Family XIII bacterium]
MKGASTSFGTVAGVAVLKPEEAHDYAFCSVAGGDAEKLRLHEATRKTVERIEALREKEGRLTENNGKPLVFDSHLMILEDDEYMGAILKRIDAETLSAERAVALVTSELIQRFEALDNPYFRDKAGDIRDIGDRLVRNLLGQSEFCYDAIPENSIIVARELTPGDVMQMVGKSVVGCVTEQGSTTAHFAILAKSFGLPVIVGIPDVESAVTDGDIIVLDLEKAEVLINPEEELLAAYREAEKEYRRELIELAAWINRPGLTGDGKSVLLEANIGGVEELPAVLDNGADGIGLFRTELLYLHATDFPSEDAQYEIYRRILEAMGGKPVTIRTLDIGGDKTLPYYKLTHEENPFLGLRAIRLCLREKTLFVTQLKALLRAGAYGNLKILLPMISGAEELREAKACILEASRTLEAEGKACARNIEVGIMIELPAAAVISDILAAECDFFSIGTNDLIQYTIGADRTNPHVAYLYKQDHPAVLRLIDMTVRNAHAAGIPVCVCGEAAGDPAFLPHLVKMDIDAYSMSAHRIPRIRRDISFLKT